MLNFDEKQSDSTIIIYNVQEFLRCLALTLTTTLGRPFWFTYGLADYGYLCMNEKKLMNLPKPTNINGSKNYVYH